MSVDNNSGMSPITKGVICGAATGAGLGMYEVAKSKWSLEQFVTPIKDQKPEDWGQRVDNFIKSQAEGVKQTGKDLGKINNESIIAGFYKGDKFVGFTKTHLEKLSEICKKPLKHCGKEMAISAAIGAAVFGIGSAIFGNKSNGKGNV